MTLDDRLEELRQKFGQMFPQAGQAKRKAAAWWEESAWARRPVVDSLGWLHAQIPRADLLLTAVGTTLCLVALRKGRRRFRTAQEIPLEYFRKQQHLRGIALSVNDSDNVRFYHCSPLSRLFWRRPSVKRGDLKYETINVRLAGIDAPEMAHFGGEAQPYAVEAKHWLTQFVEGKRVTIQLHRFDQYSRAVATVYVGRVWRRNVSIEMVKAGFATIYENGGAEYGNYEALLRKHEAEAKAKRRGMWQQAASSYKSPAEYKKQLRLAQAEGQLARPKETRLPPKWAFWRR